MLSEIEAARPPVAAIFGLAGHELTEDEKNFFKAANPLGFILFARNCQNPVQLRALSESLSEALGRAVPVLIDQEGGRVQRLRPPHWKQHPAAATFGALFAGGAAGAATALEESTKAIAAELRLSGINVNCAPVLDVSSPSTDLSIGDRAYAADPEIVAALGAIVCRAYLEAGIVPVIKHMPGLGRANLDTHKDLPVVEAALAEMDKTDFRPFREILTHAFSEAVWGMVGHAVYGEIDAGVPASCSARLIGETLRESIGFKGLLLSDDLSMGALAQFGEAPERAGKVLRAGCDIALHCNGDLKEMEAVANRIEKMTEASVMRYNRSVSWVRRNCKP